MQNTLVVAMPRGPLLLGLWLASDSCTARLPQAIFIRNFRNFEHHITPFDALNCTDIMAKQLVESLHSLKIVCSCLMWSYPDIMRGSREVKYGVAHAKLRHVMIQYLSESQFFTYLADDSVDGKRICFSLRQGPKITRKVKVRSRACMTECS